MPRVGTNYSLPYTLRIDSFSQKLMSPVTPVGSPFDQPTHHDGSKRLDQETLGFGTRAIHVGSEPDPSTGAMIPAISLSTTYKQDDIGRNKVGLVRPGIGIRVVLMVII